MDRARRNDTSTTIRRVVLLSGVREKESDSRRSTEGSFVVEKAEIERVIDDLETKMKERMAESALLQMYSDSEHPVYIQKYARLSGIDIDALKYAIDRLKELL